MRITITKNVAKGNKENFPLWKSGDMITVDSSLAERILKAKIGERSVGKDKTLEIVKRHIAKNK